MNNEHHNTSNEHLTMMVPGASHGVLSTRLTDPTPDYVWFDCEVELG